MTALFRRIFTGAALAVMAAGLASADNIISYSVSTGAQSTDITNLVATLTAWCPGCSASLDFTPSGLEPAGYGVTATATGVTMNSLSAPGITYVLQGFDIRVSSSITGNFTVTNAANASSNATGSVKEDSYTAIALGSTLSPALQNSTPVPTNDLFYDGFFAGMGPDPTTPSLGIPLPGLAPGASTSMSFSNVKTVADFGCSIVTGPPSCAVYTMLTNPATTLHGNSVNVASTDPLTFYISTATSMDTSLTGGNASTADTTQVMDVITVTYDYTTTSSAPEPTTMALMGGALLGLGLLGKRFKKS